MEEAPKDHEQNGKDAQIARDAELLSFRVYRRAIFNTPADKRYCVASVWDGRGSCQCSRKPKFEYGGHGWCSQHYPPNEHAKREARDAERRAKRAAEDALRKQREDERKMMLDALEAIKKIAAGHNDPRGLALEVLGHPTTPKGQRFD